MKKLIHILFLLLYLLPTIGLTVSYHFCGDTLVSTKLVTIDSLKESSDCCGEGEKDSTCCHTQFKSYKLDELHFASAKIELNELTFDAAEYPEANNCHLFASQNEIHNSLQTHSPPGNNTYLMNCILLI